MTSPLLMSDCTLREGEQQPGIILGVEEKVTIARLLAELGVSRAEVGTPAVSADERDAITAVVEDGAIREPLAVCRAREDDIRMAAGCGLWGVIVSSPVSQYQLGPKFGWTVQQMVDAAVRAHELAKELGLHTFASAYDTTRTDRRDLERIYGELQARGVIDGVRVVDTVGVARPDQAADLVRWCKQTFQLPVEVHFHDDFGLAVANVLAAVDAGADIVSSSVAGVGERAGNAATEEVAVALQSLYNRPLGLHLERLAAHCVQICAGMNLPVQPNRAVIGRNSFRHVSGISISGFIHESLAAQPVEAGDWGAESSVVLGKTSGAQAVGYVLGRLGVELGDDAIARLATEVKAVATAERRILSAADLVRLLQQDAAATTID